MANGLLAIPALVFMLTGAAALGQTPAPSPSPGPTGQEPKPSDCLREEKSIRPPDLAGGNAALEYFRVWDSLSAADLKELSEVAYARIIQDQPPRLDPAKRDLLLKHQDYIEGLMRCAAMPVCEWGAQHEFGEEGRLPHLSLLRNSYRALIMDYDRCLEDHNAIGAAARLAAIIRTSNQTRTDHTWISALVGSSMNYGAVDRTRDLIKSGPLTPATAKVLLDAFRGIQLEDLFGWVSANEIERWTKTQWPRTVCVGEHAGARYAEISGEVIWYGPVWPRGFLIGLNEQRLNADLDRFDRYLATIIPLWGRPQNDLKLRELELEAIEGQYGLTAGLSAWGLEQIRRGMAREQRRIVEVVGELLAYLEKEKGRTP